MKRFLIVALMAVAACQAFTQELQYTSGNNAWNADSLGNHRAVVRFNGAGRIARADIFWRRPDQNPDKKRIIVQDSATRQLVTNTAAGTITNEKGVVFFEPVSGKGIYYIYYMPYKNEGRSNYPKGVYLAPDKHSSTSWSDTLNKNMATNASVLAIQSIDTFNTFYPMEVIATEKETRAIVAKSANKNFIVFPEDRMYPVRMRSRLPYRWIKKGLANAFSGKAMRGEYYAYQLAVYGLRDLANIDVQFSDLKGANGAVIASRSMSCINAGGTDYTGRPFVKQINMATGDVQPLWCGVDIPASAKPGAYAGTVSIKADGLPAATVKINLVVTGEMAVNGGADEPQKQTRLTWLNSTLAQENTVIAPYVPLKVNNDAIALLGRKIELSADGFPKSIQTFFTPEMTGYSDQPNQLLAAPMQFNCIKNDGTKAAWDNGRLNFTTQQAGTVAWTSSSSNGLLDMQVSGQLEFDGFIQYHVRLTALQNADINDLSLDIPFNAENAKYMMGLGQKGGDRPADFKWKWEVEKKNQDGAWIGNVNAGLQYSLRDENYVRPLNTNFYLLKPLLLPRSWGNDNKGGISIAQQADTVTAHNYSGARTIKKGDTLFYNFTLLITPFHTINTDFQWDTRFYHRYNTIDSIKATGATVVNIHHATPINPWINYPFIEYKKMKAYIDEAHSKGLKVKIYNTVRELSDRAYELFPMRSLGHEIYSTGKGGGFSWLQEHVVDDYIPAWFVPEIKDAAIINSGMSRWHNYYVEGMNWLVQHVGIDGIYLDDVAFDRITMKRIKRVLTQDGHPGIIDLHSANQYNKSDGFNNSANLYMEHFPYLNRLWFGEYFDYENNSPDFFLTEVSGIPFGLMGEMLQDGGNPWRGMIYGMTNRMPWTESADPRPLWKLWDDFGMKGSEMIGYWSNRCPVKTSNPVVLATVYKKKNAALVSIASWAAEDTTVQLTINWKELGIDPIQAKITAPEIKNFQQAADFKINDQIQVPKKKGWLLLIEQK